jgi:hypothetical protein
MKPTAFSRFLFAVARFIAGAGHRIPELRP